ncbi:MAG TPA: o-succinylbenzoate synthase [Pirellulales bacterium]
MRIEAVEVFHVAMPLKSPWRTAYGEDSAIESVLVKMSSGGDSAWGEAAPFAAPQYSPEWAGGAFACIRDWLAPRLVGEWIETGDSLQAALACFKGNQFAKAALDTAWWSLKAAKTNQPLAKLIGATRELVEVGADFSVTDDAEQLIADIGAAVDAGFGRVKLKIRPGRDVNVLRFVRGAFPALTMHVDCNAGYRYDEHFEMFCRIDDFMLAMIEQPLAYDDLHEHARLQQLIRTPVCLDESITSVERAELAIELGSCQSINIKPGRVGGLTNAIKIHNLCREAGISCWVGGMLESAVGANIAAALGGLAHFDYPADVFPSSRFYEHDLAEPRVELSRTPDGRPAVRISDRPGVGAEPSPERLAACLKSHARIEPLSK